MWLSRDGRGQPSASDATGWLYTVMWFGCRGHGVMAAVSHDFRRDCIHSGGCSGKRSAQTYRVADRVCGGERCRHSSTCKGRLGGVFKRSCGIRYAGGHPGNPPRPCPRGEVNGLSAGSELLQTTSSCLRAASSSVMPSSSPRILALSAPRPLPGRPGMRSPPSLIGLRRARIEPLVRCGIV